MMLIAQQREAFSQERERERESIILLHPALIVFPPSGADFGSQPPSPNRLHVLCFVQKFAIGIVITTGTAGFPECRLHSGKAQLHSGKPSPSATLGEEPPANPIAGKSSSPSVKNRALGEDFAECRAGTRGRLDAVGRRPTSFFFYFLPRVQHSGKFFEFFLNTLCRVPQLRHSAKII